MTSIYAAIGTDVYLQRVISGTAPSFQIKYFEMPVYSTFVGVCWSISESHITDKETCTSLYKEKLAASRRKLQVGYNDIARDGQIDCYTDRLRTVPNQFVTFPSILLHLK